LFAGLAIPGLTPNGLGDIAQVAMHHGVMPALCKATLVPVPMAMATDASFKSGVSLFSYRPWSIQPFAASFYGREKNWVLPLFVRNHRAGLAGRERDGAVPSTLRDPMLLKLMNSQKVVKLSICQCNVSVLQGVLAAVERFLRNRQI
jgi:hypothetical protein